MNEYNIETIDWFNAMVKYFTVCMNCKLESPNNENTPNIKIIYPKCFVYKNRRTNWTTFKEFIY